MHKIWKYISNFGTSGDKRQEDQRAIILSNQLNFLMLICMLFLLITTTSILLLTNEEISYGTLRVAALLVVNFLNLALARFGYAQLSRLSLIYLPPVIFLLSPTLLLGYVEEESYTYYPYVLIAGSIIPQFLVHPKKEKILFWFSLSYYFLLVLFIDRFMVHFSEKNFSIVERINTFYYFYKISQVVIFLFINACIYYLLMLNYRFGEELNKRNEELYLQNIALEKQKNEIEQQKDELVKKEISTWQKLVHIISHEIINSAIPITNLAGMSSQMLEDESGAVLKSKMIDEEVVEDIHHSLKIIETRTQGLINFVKATKTLIHIQKPVFRTISLKELFDRVGILYQVKFKETDLKFETEITPPDLQVEADLEMIEQVIINIMQNALEALQETSQPKISLIALKNESGHAQISVSDNGPGISDEVAERIFLPYFSTKPNNSGIGLSLSQQIMMVHHGRLEVITGLKNGTTFVMIF
jgi:signal transduction histidine kinase